MRPSTRGWLPGAYGLAPVLFDFCIPSRVDHKVFAPGFCGSSYQSQFLFLCRIAPETIHVVIENDRTSRIVLVCSYTGNAPVPGQRLYCLGEPTWHAANCYRNG